mmetsp:Transcript_54296/g.128233  ORF Transcript_54296/g.128233 Transcript_54296/m.128233 type:complete len:87 (-) Transcript_54296:131-391(-)
MYSATNIEGPWSAQTIYTMPLPYNHGPCFGPYSHPQFAGQDEIVVSFTCSQTNITATLDNLDLYVPKFVRLSSPQRPSPATLLSLQ